MMNRLCYVLEGKTPVVEPNLTKWAEWFEASERTVANAQLGEVRVSTVFLGKDHRFGCGRPLLFETMIFGGEHDGWQKRYCTWDEAEAGHKAAVAMLGHSEDDSHA